MSKLVQNHSNTTNQTTCTCIQLLSDVPVHPSMHDKPFVLAAPRDGFPTKVRVLSTNLTNSNHTRMTLSPDTTFLRAINSWFSNLLSPRMRSWSFWNTWQRKCTGYAQPTSYVWRDMTETQPDLARARKQDGEKSNAFPTFAASSWYKTNAYTTIVFSVVNPAR